VSPIGGRGAVFLLTDYGDDDEFAGVTRAVVLREAPLAPVVDLTHRVPPFDVRAGALTLARSVVSLGPGVVVAVVDPGVGSGRRAVAVAVGRRSDPASSPEGPGILVGPDNGLLGWAVEALGGAVAAVALPSGRGQSTFDGRDLFGPVAARLWSGATLNDVGLPIDPGSLVTLPSARLVVVPAGDGAGKGIGQGGPGSVEAEVLWVDRFGNVQLAARAGDGAEAGLGSATDSAGESPGDRTGEGAGGGGGEIEIEIGSGGRRGRARWVASFEEIGEEGVGLLVDANGQLALVCRRRSAATVLGVRPGEIVTLHQVRGEVPGVGPDEGGGERR
jgi:S-adenosylmethionine hydrolase